MFKLGILGLGNMGGSILSGILKSSIYNKEEIIVYDKDDVKCNKYKVLGISLAQSVDQLFQEADVILLAIKPQNIDELRNIKIDRIYKIISIVAGKTVDDLKEIFKQCNIIRVMPNTPSIIGTGTSVIAKTKKMDEKLFHETKRIFESIGIVEVIDDSMINEVIPLNGSMPAYLYHYIQCYINKAVKMGFDEELAKKLISNAIIGSAKMVLETDKSIDELIKDVCSPGGATLKGIEVLDNSDIQLIIDDVCDACIKRAYELSKNK